MISKKILLVFLHFFLILACFSQNSEIQIKYSFEDSGRTWETTAELRSFGTKELFTISDHVHMGPTQSDPDGDYKIIKSHIYKNRENDFMIFNEIATAEFIVKEKLGFFKWTLEKESIEILGYKCQKAISTYRGRDYVAYFTTDIPFKVAPWKFHGLPGVVLKAFSTDSYLKMEALSLVMSRHKSPIINPYKRESLVSWLEFVEIYKESLST